MMCFIQTLKKIYIKVIEDVKRPWKTKCNAKVDVLTTEYVTFQMFGSLRPLSTLPYPLRREFWIPTAEIWSFVMNFKKR